MAYQSDLRVHRPNQALGRAKAPSGNSDLVAELARQLTDFGRRETRNPAVSPDWHAEHPSRDAHAQPDGDDQGIYEHDESGIEREETDYGPTHAPRRGRLITVMAVVALAAIGTAGAFAYRGMFTDSGPVPSKVGPAIQTNEQQANKRIQNRIASSQPDAQASAAVNEPKKVRTAVIRQDQADPSGRPVAAANPPRQGASAGAGGSYVQVSSQRSETNAQAAFKALQGKYPKVLGDKQAVIRRAELGDKGVYYRAMVGPFASAGQAAELCSSLKAAGGECIVQRN
jgi:SPOR domain